MSDKTSYTVRELIVELTNTAVDLDAEVCVSLHNSDPVPLSKVEDEGEGRLVLNAGV